jgi:MFS family permease
VQSAVGAVGDGSFISGSVVFFTVVVGLTPLQVGIGFSAVGLVGLVAAVPFGHLADRIGGKKVWIAGALGSAAAFGVYPVTRSFPAFLLVITFAAIADVTANTGRSVYATVALPREIRVRAMAYTRMYLNVGYMVGAGLGATALSIKSHAALIALVLIDALGMLINAAVVSRMPTAIAPRPAGGRPPPWAVLKDRPYAALSGILGALWLHAIILLQIMPLWIISKTDAPRPVLGAVFGVNTVLAAVLQVPASRAADSRRGAVRLIVRAAVAAAIACPVLAVTTLTRGIPTVVLLIAAVVLLTGTELWMSAAQWYFQTAEVPVDSRGAYSGTSRSIAGIGRLLGPAALTFLAIETGGWGWLLVAALFLVCAATIRPVANWLARTARIGAAPEQEITPKIGVAHGRGLDAGSQEMSSSRSTSAETGR